jgi:23S rRNA (cytosine1962-C5)-methyltransferase
LAKSQSAQTQALRAYSAVNAWCFSLLGEGGILVSSSCSGRVSAEDFRDALRFAAGAAKRNARVINFLGHPHDHTDTIAFSEGRYLKTMVLEVISVL